MRISRALPLVVLAAAIVTHFSATTSSAGITEPKIYWSVSASANQSNIRRANLDGTGTEVIVTGLDAPWAMDIDRDDGFVYWGDVNADALQRSDLNGSDVDTLIGGQPGVLDSPAGLSVDSASDAIYWSDFSLDRINVTHPGGSGTHTLISTGLSIPLGLQYVPQTDQIFWVDAGTNRLTRSNGDGSGITDLITGLSNPRDVAVDASSGWLYWVEFGGGLFRADLDGSNIVNIASNQGSSMQNVTVDSVNGKVYWSEGRNISRADLDGSNIERGFITDAAPSGAGVRDLSIIPEPASLCLLITGAMLATRRRRARASANSKQTNLSAAIAQSWQGGTGRRSRPVVTARPPGSIACQPSAWICRPGRAVLASRVLGVSGRLVGPAAFKAVGA